MMSLLMAHILTAFLTIIVCILAWIQPTRRMQKLLRVLTTLSLSSGLVLTLEPGHLTRATCIRLALYLLILTVTFWRLQEQIKRVESATIVST